MKQRAARALIRLARRLDPSCCFDWHQLHTGTPSLVVVHPQTFSDPSRPPQAQQNPRSEGIGVKNALTSTNGQLPRGSGSLPPRSDGNAGGRAAEAAERAVAAERRLANELEQARRRELRQARGLGLR